MYKFDVWTQYIVHARFIMITAGSMLILLRIFQINPSFPLSSCLLPTFLFSCFISAPSRFKKFSFVLVLILWSPILRGLWQIQMEIFSFLPEQILSTTDGEILISRVAVHTLLNRMSASDHSYHPQCNIGSAWHTCPIWRTFAKLQIWLCGWNCTFVNLKEENHLLNVGKTQVLQNRTFLSVLYCRSTQSWSVDVLKKLFPTSTEPFTQCSHAPIPSQILCF